MSLETEAKNALVDARSKDASINKWRYAARDLGYRMEGQWIGAEPDGFAFYRGDFTAFSLFWSGRQFKDRFRSQWTNEAAAFGEFLEWLNQEDM